MRITALALAAALAAPLPAPAQEQGVEREPGGYVINLRDTDVAVLAEQVSEITGRTLVLDPGLDGEVTVVSSEPLDREGVWALFQSILRARGFAAVATGTIWQVVPEAELRARGGDAGPGDPGGQDFVTQVIRLEQLAPAEAVRILGPLVAESGYIEALADPPAILVADTRTNVARIAGIANRLDAEADRPAQILPIRFAEAAGIGAAIQGVLGEAGTDATVSVDPVANALLVRGSPRDVAEVRRLAAALDVAPREDVAEAIRTEVFALSFGDAEVVAELVRGALGGGGPAVTNPVAQALAESPVAVSTSPDQPPEAIDADTALPGGLPAPVAAPGEVAVLASSGTNSVIVRGTAAQIADAAVLIRALDTRRPQVLIEAAIVEVSEEVGERLGVQLGLAQGIPTGAFAATSLSNAGPSLQSILVALGETGGAALSTGLSIGLGAGDFGALVSALAQSTQANLLSTPSITTLDNEAATIVVGQNVPFRTGAFVTDGANLTPFTTIERRDVGITMSVLPRVTAGGVVRLEISQEVSSLVDANVLGAADLVTNRRVIDTVVQADNGGTVVLGGLITDDRTGAEDRVPGLGRVPVVGELFKSRRGSSTRRTLFVFLRPTVLATQGASQAASTSRAELVRDAQRALEPGRREPGRALRMPSLEIGGLY